MWFQEKKYAWYLLGALWLIALISTIPRFVMAFYQGQIAEDLDSSRGFISFAWSLNLLITAACLPVGGWLVDRFGPKRILLAGRIVGVIAAAVTYFSAEHAFYFLLGYGVLFGLTGISATTEFSLLFHWFKHKRGTANTILRSASPLGLALISPIFVANRDWLSWSDAFLLTSVLGLVLSLPLIQLVVKDPTSEPAKAAGDTRRKTVKEFIAEWKGTVSSPIMLAVVMALFVCGFNMGTVEMSLVAIHDHAHVPVETIGVALSLLGLMDVAGSLFFGVLLDRYSRTKILAVLYVLRTIGFLLLLLSLPVSPMVFSILFGATYVGVVPGSLLVASEWKKESGAQTGSLLLLHSLGGIAGSLLGGVTFDLTGDYRLLIGLNLGLCVLTAGLFLFGAMAGRHTAKQEVAKTSH
ncbi:MFS transporter [Brevibacillus migulae]|uniref:MFS transporter n=1 Tax=Brevibacillus migulae TaxID=1644114 RepID=UPI00106E1EB3|nr:MFS transporter [Brevibacillus migulae]